MSDPLRATLRLDVPVDLRRTFAPLRRGPGDPSVRLDGRTLWRATATPHGPASQALVVGTGGDELRAWAWGPGAGWLIDGLPDLVGGADRRAAFDDLVSRRPAGLLPPGWELVASLGRRHGGLRIPRTRAVFEAAVPTVLEQKVTGVEAHRSYRELLAAVGEPAPGPAGQRGLLVPPDPAALAATPLWRLHAFGVERKRGATLQRVAAGARRLEEAVAMEPRAARSRLEQIAGLGAWSSAEVALAALGDSDAVSLGDYHLPNQVAWAMTGVPRGDDRLMLELLEPWRGHRGLVLRLLVAGGVTAPRFGPRQPVRSFRRC